MKWRRTPPEPDATKIRFSSEITNYCSKKVYTLCRFRWIWGLNCRRCGPLGWCFGPSRPIYDSRNCGAVCCRPPSRPLQASWVGSWGGAAREPRSGATAERPRSGCALWGARPRRGRGDGAERSGERLCGCCCWPTGSHRHPR